MLTETFWLSGATTPLVSGFGGLGSQITVSPLVGVLLEQAAWPALGPRLNITANARQSGAPPIRKNLLKRRMTFLPDQDMADKVNHRPCGAGFH